MKKSRNWKCLGCKHKWPHPIDSVPKCCPECGDRNIFDINLSPVTAAELAALGLPTEWPTAPAPIEPKQYHLRARS